MDYQLAHVLQSVSQVAGQGLQACLRGEQYLLFIYIIYLYNLLITFVHQPASLGLGWIHHSVEGGKNDRINLDFLSVGYLKCTKADQSFHFYF